LFKGFLIVSEDAEQLLVHLVHLAGERFLSAGALVLNVFARVLLIAVVERV
jgi:hypothetical protein